MSGLDFLNDKESVKLPVGGDFQASGFIGRWFAQVGFAFWSETDLGALAAENKIAKPDASRQMGQGFKYFYRDFAAADAARGECGLKYPPKQTWLFLCKRADVLNIGDEEILAKFSDPIWMDLEIVTLRSKKLRHGLHMISLPAAVASAANLLKYDNPGFDLSELLDGQAIYDDKFQWKMVGRDYDDAQAVIQDPVTGEEIDLKAFDGKVILKKSTYPLSLLWKRREALWKALGEENPTVYNPIGAGTQFDTTSEKLSKCLGILAKPWKSAIWCRLMPVPSPVVDATFDNAAGESKRLTIPALVEIFESEKAARAVAQVEVEARQKASGNGAKSANGKQVPVAWADTPDEWIKWVEETLKPKLAGKSPAFIRKWAKENEKDILATPDEVLAWVA